MSAVKIFHTADLHIGAELSYLGIKATERRFEVASVFSKIVGYCKDNNVEICLISGDLFDSNTAAAEFAPSVFEYIASAPDVRFLYVAGNHDPLDASSPMKSSALPENLYVFGTEYEVKEFADIGVRVIGRSFAHSSIEAAEFSTVLPQDEFVNIMLLHADLGADKSSPYNPIGKEFIENSGVNYLALGHIHKRTGISKLGGTYLSYPGSPEGQGFDEEGVHGGYCGTLTKDSCELSFVKLSRRVHRIETIDVSSAISSINAADIVLKKLSDTYGEGYENDLYKIILTGSINEGVTLKNAEILQILKDKLYFVKVKDSTKKAYDLEQLKNEVSLKGVFVNKMLGKIAVANEEDKPIFESALYLGLNAFDSEVAYSED